jgi:hypothetical protein
VVIRLGPGRTARASVDLFRLVLTDKGAAVAVRAGCGQAVGEAVLTCDLFGAALELEGVATGGDGDVGGEERRTAPYWVR